MAILVNINGVISPAERATIPVLDHGFLFGDSVYETLRTYGGKPFLFSRHLVRLDHSAGKVYLLPSWNREQMRAEVHRTLEAAGNTLESRIRIIVTRGVGALDLDPIPCHSPNIVIFVTALAEVPPHVYENGVDVMISSFHRNLQLAEVKSSNLIRQVLALREARTADSYEAVLLTPDGWISDGITSNVYLIQGRTLLTPAREAGIIEGITRGVVLDLARRIGLKVVEGILERKEIEAADEMFLTSTTREVVPIVRVDGRPIANGKPGAVTRQLLESYRREVHVLIQED